MVGLNLQDLGARAENLRKSWTGFTEYLRSVFSLSEREASAQKG